MSTHKDIKRSGRPPLPAPAGWARWTPRWLFLWIAGYSRFSYCWLGLHRWDYPGGHCEKCGKCDEFFGPHEHQSPNDRGQARREQPKT